MLSLGRVTQDDQQARQWYEKAAAAGIVEAMLILGWLYKRGQQVTQEGFVGECRDGVCCG
jgi:TPR repeat protein